MKFELKFLRVFLKENLADTAWQEIYKEYDLVESGTVDEALPFDESTINEMYSDPWEVLLKAIRGDIRISDDYYVMDGNDNFKTLASDTEYYLDKADDILTLLDYDNMVEIIENNNLETEFNKVARNLRLAYIKENNRFIDDDDFVDILDENDIDPDELSDMTIMENGAEKRKVFLRLLDKFSSEGLAEVIDEYID